METYDIAHNNETVYEAMIKFIEIYNRELCKGNKHGFEIIHGYGSSGTGGKIKKELLLFLEQNFEAYEIYKIDNGKSQIIPIKTLPEYISIIDKDIIDFCITPKSFNKIAGMIYKKIKCFTDKDILIRIHCLCKDDKLKSVYKNKLKCYVKI